MRGYDDEDIPLRHIAPFFGRLHFSYHTDKTKLELNMIYNGAITNDRLAPSEQDKPYMYATDSDGLPYSPSWWTLNFKAAYQITEKLQINAGLENILNKRYRPYSSGIVAPGRNLFVAVRAKI